VGQGCERRWRKKQSERKVQNSTHHTLSLYLRKNKKNAKKKEE
jgi:hypothetical protein